MEPVFSIFTPVYNSEDYIKICLESVLNQSFSDFEWFIYDDGSSDRSYEICEEYSKRDNRIILSKGQNGTSLSEMNKFLKTAKGEFIAFIDNDDYWSLDYLENVLSYLRKSNADCAITSYTLVNEKNHILNLYTPNLNNGEVIDQLEVKRRFLTTLDIEGFRWNKFYKSSVIQKSCLKFKNIYPPDIGFEYALTSYIDKAVLINIKGYFYRQSSKSQVGSVNIDKSLGMLHVFSSIGDKALKEGLEKEGWYYKAWRYVNSMFLRLKGDNLSKDDKVRLFRQFPWKKMVGKSIFSTLVKFAGFSNHRDSFCKFMLKTLYVWINSKRIK